MRTKKILSLILAIAMMATISVSAAQSEVYIYEDFDYDSVDEFHQGFGWLDENGEQTEDWRLDRRKNDVTKAAFATATRALGKTRRFLFDATNIGGYKFPYWSVEANSNGDKAYRNFDKDVGNGAGYGENIILVPTKPWRGVEHADEAYVISYDYEVVGVRNIGATDSRVQEGTYTASLNANGQKVYTYSPALTPAAGYLDYGPIYIYKTLASDSSDKAYTTINNKCAVKTTTHTPDTEAELPEGIVEQGTYVHTLTGEIDMQNAASGAYGTSYKVAPGEVHTFTSVITKKSDTSLQRTTYVDGVKYGSTTTKNLDADYVIEGFNYGGSSWVVDKVANIKIYTLKTTAGAFNAASTVDGEVSASAKTLKVKFSQPVNADTFDKTAVTMTKNGEPLAYGTDFTVSDVTEVIENEGGEIYSEATISFMTDLEASSEYVVTFPGTIKNTIGTALDGYNKVTFETPTPDILVDSFEIVTGFGTASEATAESFVANGTLQGAAIALKNTTEVDKNVAVIYAAYASNGQLIDVVYANDTIKAASIGEVNAGVTLSEIGKVKAFIWDGVNSLKPYSDATVKTVSAPEFE